MRRCLAVLGSLVIVGCSEPLGHSDGSSLTLLVEMEGNAAAVLDSGRIFIQGPITRTLRAAPGQVVTIDSLRGGTYTVGLEGYTTGFVTHFGQATGIVVTPGQNTAASVPFAVFGAPTLQALPNYFTTRTLPVSVSTGVPGAGGYEFMAASDAAFTANVATVQAVGGTAGLVVPTDAVFRVRVRARTPFGGAGAWSAVQTTRVDVGDGRFYLIRDSDEMVRVMHPATFVITNLGPLGIAYEFGDCAWNPANSTLYATDGRPAGATNALYRINLTTGAATLVGGHGIVDMFSIGYHQPTNTVYGISVATDQTYRFNLTSGGVTLVGPTGPTLPYFGGLVWDPVRNRFVAITAGPGDFWTINTTTGAATTLAPSPSSVSDVGLAYDPIADRFVSADYGGAVREYDPTANFAVTPRLTGQGPHTCIAWVP